MGTTYMIKYSRSLLSTGQIQKDINDILDIINNQMSTYQADSEISIFNRMNAYLPFEISSNFYYVLEKSNYYYNLSEGIFDVTINQLSSLWGFDKKKPFKPSDNQIKNPLELIGFNKIQLLKNNTILKTDNQIQLTLNAIAKGYALDEISNYLDNNNIENYMIEIGGEVKVKGNSVNGKKWIIGLSGFNNDIDSIVKSISITDAAVATSGDYRNFIIYDDLLYSHIINPSTGYPADNKVVSATVIANYCIDADALATILSIMSIEKSLELINSLNNTECLIVERDEESFNYYYSKNMKKYIN